MAGLAIHHQRQFPVWRVLFGLVLIGFVVLSGWYGYRWYTVGEEPPLVPIASAKPGVDMSELSRADIDAYKVPKSEPRYISIPELGLEKARVQKVGVTANNDLATPKNVHDTGWFERSATPGSGYGAVLIDGHTGSTATKGAFAGLKNLKKGDQIRIERGDGEEFIYSVVENKSMALEQVLKGGLKTMMKSIDPRKEGLSLITDDGKWVPRYQQFDHRVMLRAVALDDE